MSLPGAKQEFRTVDKDANKVYSENIPEKGDSWKRMPLTELYALLDEKFHEIMGPQGLSSSPEKLRSDLVDLINFARMLAKRLVAARQ